LTKIADVDAVLLLTAKILQHVETQFAKALLDAKYSSCFFDG
jgi:hypothetical protein